MITLFGIYRNNNLSNMGLNLCKIIVDSRNNPFKHEESLDVSDQIFYINFELFERFVEREEPFKYYDEYKEDTEVGAKVELFVLMFLDAGRQTRKINEFEELTQEDREMLERLIKLSYRFWT